MKQNILVTICARGGSKGVKNKNIKKLNGRPLISYSIQQALDWGKAKRVVVSTDSEEIASIAKKYGADVPFLRPGNLATDASAKLPVIRHALQESQNIYNEDYSIIVDLDATAPIRTTDDLDKAFEVFQKSESDTLFSVVHAHKNPYFNMVMKTERGYERVIKSNFYARQEAPEIYDMNASLYAYSPEFLISGKELFGGKCGVIKMMDTAVLDIDHDNDFEFMQVVAEYLFDKYPAFFELRDNIISIYTS